MTAPATGRLPAAWLMVLGAATVCLHLAGGALPSPPLVTPADWPAWAEGRDPVVVAFAVVRLPALAAAWYVLAVTGAGVALRLASAPRLAALVDAVTVAPLRRVVATTVVVALSAGPLAGAGAAVAGASTSASVPAGALPAPPTSAAPPTPAAPDAPGTGTPPVTVTMRRVVPAPASPPTSAPPPNVGVAPAPTPSPPEALGASSPDTAATWTVRPGQCFWSIADRVLGRTWGRPPTDAEIVPYWHRLIEANRAQLSDPQNPDLVFAGQVFSLPEV